MKILIFGAGGFIGSHLTAHLLGSNHQVVGVDTHTDKIKPSINHQNFRFIEQDIRGSDFPMEKLVANADLVIGLIAHANPGLYIRNPLEVFELNFKENLKIVEACVASGRRLIQFSSSEVYGKTLSAVFPDELKDPADPKLATFNEDSTGFFLGPVNSHRWIYACAKQLLERVLHAYGLEGKLRYTVIRPFNFIGPDIDYLPSDTDGVPRVFPYFMEALLKGTPMKLVNGGNSRRCYTDIEDAVRCIGLIVDNKGGVCDGQIFNIGSPDNEVSIADLAELMRAIYSSKYHNSDTPLPQPVNVSGEEFYGAGYDDSDRRIPDTTKAQTLLGWEPKIPLAQTLERTIGYYVTPH